MVQRGLGPSAERGPSRRIVSAESHWSASTPATSTPTDAGVVLAPDDWLAQVFGYPVFRLSLGSGQPDRAAVADVVARAGQPAFLYAKLETHAVAQVRILEQVGFGVTDTTITLEKNADPGAEVGAGVRFAVPADEKAVTDLAADTFSWSRFHLDPQIPRATADAVKAKWAASFFRGTRGHFMVVATVDKQVTGFLQLLCAPADAVTIDLIGVAAGMRGRGLATDMIKFAEARVPGCNRIIVGTQIANIGSVRLYERLGFHARASTYVLHHHISRVDR